MKVEQWRKGGLMYADERDEEAREVGKLEKRKGWYKGSDKYDCVMFVQPTKNSELKRKIQEIAKRNKMKVRVVERAGLTMKKVLQRSDPYMRKRCERNDCPVCDMGKPGECSTRGRGYQLTCKEDGRKYRGQTGRSLCERVK